MVRGVARLRTRDNVACLRTMGTGPQPHNRACRTWDLGDSPGKSDHLPALHWLAVHSPTRLSLGNEDHTPTPDGKIVGENRAKVKARACRNGSEEVQLADHLVFSH